MNTAKKPVSTKAKAPNSKRPPNQLNVTMKPDDDPLDRLAQIAISPTVRAALTVQAFSKSVGDTDIQSLVSELENQCKKARGGDPARSESLLLSQAHALDGIFHELARRAAMNMGEHLNATDTYLRLALKAQGQCRATLETLSVIKNPPVIFAKQANISNGPQQVNNGTAPLARETVIEQSKQSGGSNELLTDTRASQAASRVNQTMEAVGEIHRA